MTPVKVLQTPCTPGRVERIVVRDAPRAPAREVESTVALAGIGLADDRLGQRGAADLSTRQVTLVQHEHLPVIAQLAHVDAVDALALRRNLVVSGINLQALKNARVRIGGALLEIVGPCHPCSRIEETIGPGGCAAMRGHGGMTARIIEGGAIARGDAVTVEAPRPAEDARLQVLTPGEAEAVVEARIEQFGLGALPRVSVSERHDGAWLVRWLHQERVVRPMAMPRWQAWLAENVGSLDAGDLETTES